MLTIVGLVLLAVETVWFAPIVVVVVLVGLVCLCDPSPSRSLETQDTDSCR